MKQKLMLGIMLSACVCASVSVVAGQQPARARRGGGGLDNLSLPSTSERASAATAEAMWQTFAPEGAGFSVSLPGIPEEAIRAGHEQAQLNRQFRAYELAAGGLNYVMTRAGVLPEQLMSQPKVAESMFAGAGRGLATGLEAQYPQIKFQLVSQQAISLGIYEGREFDYAAARHRSVARVFLVKGSVFILTVLGAKSDMTPDKVNKFLDSFALVE